MNILQPKKVVSSKEFLARFREQVLFVADVGPRSVGRPKKSDLGIERQQMDNTVGAQIASRLILQMEENREVLEPPAQSLYSEPYRASWAAKQLTAMTTINSKATHPDPFVRARKMLNDLIVIGEKRRPEGGRSLVIRVATNGATQAELRVFTQRIFGKGRLAAQMATESARCLNTLTENMMPGERFDEIEARHAEDVRKGKFDLKRMSEDGDGDDEDGVAA